MPYQETSDLPNWANNELRSAYERIAELESVNAALKNSLETKGILAAGLHIERLTFAVAALEKEKLELLDRLVRLEAENANLKIADNKNYEHWFGHKIKTFIWKK